MIDLEDLDANAKGNISTATPERLDELARAARGPGRSANNEAGLLFASNTVLGRMCDHMLAENILPGLLRTEADLQAYVDAIEGPA